LRAVLERLASSRRASTPWTEKELKYLRFSKRVVRRGMSFSSFTKKRGLT
jgi:hypothetical protein